MTIPASTAIDEIFPVCKKMMNPAHWRKLLESAANAQGETSFAELLEELANTHDLPPWLADLARLEACLAGLAEAGEPEQEEETIFRLNPRLDLLQLRWSGLLALLGSDGEADPAALVRRPEFILAWRLPATSEIRRRVATEEDLLVLKLMVEKISPEEAAAEGGIPVGAVDRCLDRAVDEAILLRPASRIRRAPSFPRGREVPDRFFAARVFTLQWHITQACDLHCRHCYDRSSRLHLPFDRALVILDEMRSFCRRRHVQGQISFSGGNPLLYPRFFELYREAVNRNLGVAILGNPAGREDLERLLAIEKPRFYQVSLEGLAEHNDYIRGAGHFERVMDFLELLRKYGIYSMVMLTLTRDNLDQVLALAEHLRGRVDLFTYNRLAMVGEGADLLSVEPDRYRDFTGRYQEAARQNPVISLKDGLINLQRRQNGLPLFGGCAGYGCGAAFNFLAVLPDGEVHACRKFPSFIGNIFDRSLAEIYDSETAVRYRTGSSACTSCDIRPVCGGCLAVVHGYGLDVFTDRDPCCFVDAASSGLREE